MLFNSPEFIFLFLPLTALGFFLWARFHGERAAVVWLIAASLFFYGWWNPIYVLLILASIGANYRLGLAIVAARRRSEPLASKRITVAGIIGNVALIGYYKYADFFVDTVSFVVGAEFHLHPIVLPLGISFFTFQQIAYLIDAHRGKTEEHSFAQYALFILFFPQLIAGPIVHHKEMLPQFARPQTYRLQYSNLAIGVTIFVIGLFKKVVIADNLAQIANPVFAAAEQGEALHFFQAANGLIAYTLQIYFDFSGYSDMALGLARIFGVRLPLNFDSPYRATSIIDFWRRWHMTLSRFLRDYVYFGLGGNRLGPARRYLNLMTTMLIGGLWHGAGWNFVLWGAIHGAYLVANHAWNRVCTRPANTWWSIAAARLTTLLFVMIAWVFFRAETLEGATTVFKGFTNLPATLPHKIGPCASALGSLGFSFHGPGISDGDVRSVALLVIWIAILWWTPNTQQLMDRFAPAYDWRAQPREPAALQKLLPWLYWRPGLAWSAFIALLASLALLSLTRVSEFLYFQF